MMVLESSRGGVVNPAVKLYDAASRLKLPPVNKATQNGLKLCPSFNSVLLPVLHCGSILVSHTTQGAAGRAGKFEELKKQLDSTNLGGAEVVLGLVVDKVAELNTELVAIKSELKANKGHVGRLLELESTGCSSLILVYECMTILVSKLTKLYENAYDTRLTPGEKLHWERILSRFSKQEKKPLGRELKFEKLMTVLYRCLDSPLKHGLGEADYFFAVSTLEPLYRRIVADYCSNKVVGIKEMSFEEQKLVTHCLAPADESELLGVLHEWELLEENRHVRNAAEHVASWNKGGDPGEEVARLVTVAKVFQWYVESKSDLVKGFPRTSVAALFHMKKRIEEKKVEAAATCSSPKPATAPWQTYGKR